MGLQVVKVRRRLRRKAPKGGRSWLLALVASLTRPPIPTAETVSETHIRAVTSIVRAILSTGAVLFALYVLADPPTTEPVRTRIIAGWTIWLPLYFWAEYHMMAATCPKWFHPNREYFVKSQEMSRTVWLAILAVLVTQLKPDLLAEFIKKAASG